MAFLRREMSTTIGAARRPKWQYIPTPRILHLPRGPHRKSSKCLSGKPTSNSMEDKKERKGKLENLFDQERVFSKTSVPVVLLEAGEESERRRERVGERENCNGGGGEVGMEEEKWRFQAEMLRAECNFLTMDKEIALRKLERSRIKMEKTLRTAVQTLVSVRRKIQKGNNVEIIHQLAEKLEKLRSNLGVEHSEVNNNFDKQATVLQRQLETFRSSSDEFCVEEIQEMAAMSLSTKSNSIVSESLVPSNSSNVEILRRKMERLSNGMLLERMKEEYGSMFSTANSSASSSTSTSRGIQYKETRSQEKSVCSGRCKVIARRIVEQVRAETEQWSQMQQMLGKVREEIEELQASRDYWEYRALNNDTNVQSLRSTVQEWRQKAMFSESKEKKLESKIFLLHKELEKVRKKGMKDKGLTLTWWDEQNEMEKHVLVCHTNENSSSKHKASNNGSRKSKTWINDRSPFREIGNYSSVFI